MQVHQPLSDRNQDSPENEGNHTWFGLGIALEEVTATTITLNLPNDHAHLENT